LRRLLNRTVLTAAATLALGAGSVVALPASPAHAGGGGCITWSKNGYSVGVCVSARDGYAYPDLYLNAQPAQGSNCTIRSQMIGPGGDPFRTVYYPCVLGHHGPFRFYLTQKGYHYYHLVHVIENGRTKLTGNSYDVWR